MTNRSQRRKRTQAPPQQFHNRLATLRLMLDDDPAMAGDQSVKLLEEYLEALAHSRGYKGDGSLGRYAQYLRGREALPDDLLDRADAYTQLRNCLAHTFGLQTSPALANELVEFLELLFKHDATTVEELMTHDVRVVSVNDQLDRVRDVMVRGGYGRLPVVGQNGATVGLLTERDIVVALTRAEQNGGIHRLSVADVLPDDTLEQVAFLRPDASREEAAEALRQPRIVACLVTPSGTAHQRPIGILTHADLLYRM